MDRIIQKKMKKFNHSRMVGDWLKLPLNTERLNKLTENYVASNAQIKKTLGKELPISAREGLNRTIASFRD